LSASLNYDARVTWTPKTRRRTFGALCLLAAVALLLFGNTKPQPGQSHGHFVAYWAACFVFAALAMVIAIRDAGALRQEAREQQRALFESTLQNIEAEKRRRTQTGDAPGNSADLRD
jgi:peptidoglycan/LPS O-acetylase OafA/YrhL